MHKHLVDSYHSKELLDFERKKRIKLYVNMGILIFAATANIVV